MLGGGAPGALSFVPPLHAPTLTSRRFPQPLGLLAGLWVNGECMGAGTSPAKTASWPRTPMTCVPAGERRAQSRTPGTPTRGVQPAPPGPGAALNGGAQRGQGRLGLGTVRQGLLPPTSMHPLPALPALLLRAGVGLPALASLCQPHMGTTPGAAPALSGQDLAGRGWLWGRSLD